jgi:hypothetical protein
LEISFPKGSLVGERPVLFRMAVECSTAGPDPKAEHLVDAAALLGTTVICVGKVGTLNQCKYLPNMVCILL